MYGTLSQSDSGRGVAFYRLMAVACIVGNIIFALFFILFYPFGRELIVDRVFFIIASLTLYGYGRYTKIKPKFYVRLVYAFFYFNSAYIVWTVYYNNFDGFYLLSLLIAVQVFAFSLRDQLATFWYVLVTAFFTLFVLLISDCFDIATKGNYMGVIIVVGLLQYHSARLKCHFMLQMRMNQNLLRSLIAKSEDAVFLTDLNGNVLDINPRVTELFGYDKQEVLDKDFSMLRKKALSEDEMNDGLIQLETHRFWTTESVLMKKGGAEFPARLSMTLIKNGSSSCLVYRVLDITIIKENETRLIDAKEKAEEAVLAKSQFLAIMSHEIRTPLNGVIATASLLQNTPLSFEQEEYCNTVIRSGQSLMMLINDILEFSKMENQKMELHKSPEKLQDVVFDVIDLLRPHAQVKGIDLNLEFDHNIRSYVSIDVHRLKQVLFNLVGNALKFTEKGNVAVLVKCTSMNHGKGLVEFTIKDTGIGIAEDKFQMLFKSFSQVDSSISRKYGGTGLGLVISKQIVELMGGTISVSSKIGVGTTFQFSIPMEFLTEGTLRAMHDVASEESEFDYSRIHVLVAEDNELNKQVLQFILQNLKVNYEFADNGLEAVNMCRSKNYDIVFMDLNMPELDGLSATYIIRSEISHQPVIVAISANAFSEDKKSCSDAGMNDFLPKPFELSQLKSILRKWYQNGATGVHSAA